MLTGTVRAPTESAIPLRLWLVELGDRERDALARLWGLAPTLDVGALADAMLSGSALADLLGRLDDRTRAMLARVQERGGTIAAPILEREGGPIRQPGTSMSQRAYLLALRDPPSPTERLYLLGLIQLVGEGARRFYAIPPDLLPVLPPVPPREVRLALRLAAAPAEMQPGDVALLERRLLALLALAHDGQLETIPAGGLTKASLVLLARRWGIADELTGVTRENQWPYAHFLRRTAQAAGLVRQGQGALRVAHEALEWLRLPRVERLQRLLDGWAGSEWDELAALEGIRAQQPYTRDVPAARRALLALLAQGPNRWVELDSFVDEVKRAEPDYARPDGDYFRWGLLDRAGRPLGGFVNWDAVEGAQIRAVLGCSLRWLGLADVGLSGGQPVSFRLTAYGQALLRDGPAPDEPPDEPLVVQPNFEVLAPPHASPYVHFQLGRVAEAGGGEGVATFRLTRRSVQAAAERGVDVAEILRFLEEQGGRPAPQNVAATLREWAGRYGQVELQRGYVLRASEPALLEQARRDGRVRMPAVEELSDTAWLVREGEARSLAERLRKAGYGLAADAAAEGPLSEHDLAVAVAALEFYAEACELLGAPCAASAALRRRVARLLRERELNRAYQASGAALEALRKRLGALMERERQGAEEREGHESVNGQSEGMG